MLIDNYFVLLPCETIRIQLLKTVRSIQPITEKYDTMGSSPILVIGSDFNQWVCKYNDVNKLFNELLASEFAKSWQINIPETALVQIDYDRHIIPFNNKKGLERRFFERECFGSRFLDNAFDVNKTLLVNKDIVQRIKNKEDFLKIALFDIWLANEDRNAGNYNLLLRSVKGGYALFYIIDNTDIFNSSMAYRQNITEITEEDSILNSDLANLLFNKDFLAKNVSNLLNEFPILAEKCKTQLAFILEQVPEKWHIDKFSYEVKIKAIFSDNWLKICEQLFRTYIKI